MGDTTFLATWDDTGNVGVVNLTKAELKEFTTSAGSDNGELITSIKIQLFHWQVSCVLSGARREILMEMDELSFKLRMGFDICSFASEEGRMLQVEEDPSVIYHRCMCHISA
jgi:hypothetical protein